MKSETPPPTPAAPGCSPADHPGHEKPAARPTPDPAAVDRAARLFRALGDGPRLRLLHLLSFGECCVTELVAATGEKFPTVSQRLRVLRTEGLVGRRRDGLHVYYSLADRHVADMLANALEHAGELTAGGPTSPGPTGPDVPEDDR